MKFLLDTNVVSELRKPEQRRNRGVTDWFETVSDDTLYLSVLVLGELRRGVELLRRRDAAGAEALDRWLSRLCVGYQERILGVDAEVAERWGRINVPDPLPAVDGIMAATALTYGLTFVTRNVQDVARTGVMLLNPFEDQ